MKFTRLALWALLFALVAANLPGAVPVAAAPAAAVGPCDDTAFWRCRHHLGTLQPTSVTSEGMSLFMMDPPNARIEQLRFGADGGFTQLPLPWLPVSPSLPPAALGSLVLGPRAFYAIVTFPDRGDPSTYTPLLWRADRIPTAISGGWRFLRGTAGAADVGLASVVMNRTVWMLRSCSESCREARRKGSNAAFAVDWQPLATENSQILQPPGPTIDLGDSVQARPAAGVTATADAIYVFGGRDTPLSATRIPLKSGSPGQPQALTELAHPRRAATALVHGTTVYLVGGNNPGDPVIERGKIEPRADPGTPGLVGNIRRWEPVPDPALPSGVGIRTATFARGQLWIIRDDGWIQTLDVAAVAPGRSRLTWDRTTAVTVRLRPDGSEDAPVFTEPAPPQPISVRRGDTIDLTLDWSYAGAQTFDGIVVDVVGVPSDTGVRRSAPFISPTKIEFPPGSVTLLPPNSAGPQIQLQAVIPRTVTDPRRNRTLPDRRTEYNATVQITAGGQRLGPIQRLRFVVERPRR